MLGRVNGVIIRSIDYGEGNKIVTLLTKEQGKISMVARGAKKLKSRFGSAVQLFTYGQYSMYRGSSSSLASLNYAEIIDAHHKIREDLHLAAQASYLAELTDRMIPDQEGQPYLFEQLKASLEALEDSKDAAVITSLFEMKILVLAGVQPELMQCVSCSGEGPYPCFSTQLGGVLCERCRLKDPNAVFLQPGIHKLLQLLHTDVRRIGETKLRPESKTMLRHIIRTYYDQHIGIPLKSRSFLDQMDRYGI